MKNLFHAYDPSYRTSQYVFTSGPHDDETAREVGYMGTQYNISTVAGTVQSHSLSNGERFRYFNRVYPPFSVDALAFATLVKSFKWEQVAVISSTDSLYMPLALDFTENVQENNSTSVSSYFLPPSFSRSMVREVARTILASGIRAVFFAASDELALELFPIAEEIGLFETGFTWLVVSHGMFGSKLHQIKDVVDRVRRHIISGYGNVYDPTNYNFIQSYLNALPSDIVPVTAPVHIAAASYNTIRCGATALHNLLQVKLLCDNPATPDIASSQECVKYESEDGDRETLLRMIRTRSFLSQQGEIQLDRATGDLITNFIVVQPVSVDATWVRGVIQTVNSTAHFNLIDNWVFPDGSSNVPASSSSTRKEEMVTSRPVFYILLTFVILCAIFTIYCGYATLRLRNHPVIRMSSYRVNLIGCVGSLLLLSAIPVVGTTATPSLCATQLSLAMIGFTLLYAPLFAKTWRAAVIFQGAKLKETRMTDWQLFRTVGYIVAVDSILLILWITVDPFYVEDHIVEKRTDASTGETTLSVVGQCHTRHEYVFSIISGFIKAVLLAFGAFYAYQTRTIRIPAMNDSKWTGLAIYSTLLLASINIPVVFLLRNENVDAAFIFTSLTVILLTTIVMGLVFVPKILLISGDVNDVVDSVDWETTGTGNRISKQSLQHMRERRIGTKPQPQPRTQRSSTHHQMSHPHPRQQSLPISATSNRYRVTSYSSHSNEPRSILSETPLDTHTVENQSGLSDSMAAKSTFTDTAVNM